MSTSPGSQEPEPRSPGSLAQRLKQRFGEDVDPGVSLGASDEHVEAGADFASVLVARLSGRSGSFGRYQLKGEIARGGMGAILKIWDEDLHRHLAMKVILGQVEARSKASGAGESPKAGVPSAETDTPPIETSKLARFLEEAQVTGQLDHPGIVPVHELGLDPEGRVYFTMKLVKGRSLKEVFDLVADGREGWSQTKALGVLLKVCEAMAYAHDKGVIHRDLKPANVMVGKFGEVHVMDWGLARILGREDERDIRIREVPTTISTELRSERDEHRGQTPDSPLYTMDGDVVGTPAYMPPEQAAGRVEEMGPHSDVYALGAMLYHLLAGHMPYVPHGALLNNYAVWNRVQEGPPIPIAQLAPGCPAELVAICEKAMARDWKQRYRDVSELSADLSAYLEHRVVGAYQTGAWAEAKKWVERNKALAASLAVGVVALVAGLIVSLALKEKADEQALLAEARRVESRKNELAAQTNAAEAERQRSIAKGTLEDLLSLSAIQDLRDLLRRADELWPAVPANVPAYVKWIEEARMLLEGSPGDEARGIKSRPSLTDLRRKLAEIETRALPQSEEAQTAERQTHPRAEELRQMKAKLEWMSRMLGRSAWPGGAEANSEVARWNPPPDAGELNELAWLFVDPDGSVFGEEVKGLLLARRAVEGASDEDRPAHRDTLAWALFRVGRFEEALAEERKAVDAVPEKDREAYEGYFAKLEASVEAWSSPTGRAERESEFEQLSERVAALEREVARRRTWDFADRKDRWWHAQLASLVADLEAFSDPTTSPLSGGITPEHGWGVEKRLEFARTIEERSVSGPKARQRWAEAIASIGDRDRCPSYGGLVIEPRLGFLPIGRDAASGLWEFADLATGDPAEREADGELLLREETGLVFVLIPGGTFLMGAQSTDPTEENYDRLAGADESPRNEVTLAPFFLSKYEMTQAQWQRLTGGTPSLYGPHNYDRNWNAAGRPASLLHPVEQVSWDQCTETLGRLGAVLPTEAQWEYACRAGTSTVFWSGDEAESLQGVANVSDAYGKSHGNEHYELWEAALDDGQTVHAEVGRYRPNPFGLFDVHGNVFEWCRDGYGAYSLPVREGDGSRRVPEPRTRVFRGGSFAGVAAFARSAVRRFDVPSRTGSGVGVRPAAELTLR